MGVTRAPLPASSRTSGKGRRKTARRLALLVGVSLLAGGGYLGWQELESSRWQSQWLSRYAADLDYTVKPGPSPRIQFPEDGPFDRRLGYVDLPNFIERLVQRNFRIEEQARFARAAGLHQPRLLPALPGRIPGRADDQRLSWRTALYQQLSAPVLRALRRHSAAGGDEPAVHRGPRVAGRQPAERQPGGGLAALHQGGHQPAGKRLGLGGQAAGGSTLATQVEKYRHSPKGAPATRRKRSGR